MGEFDAATQAHALHAPGGRVTTTGLGGFTTGGGYGWPSCKHGLACDYLRELSDAAIAAFVGQGVELTRLGAPLSQMVILPIGQGVEAAPDEASAFSHRDAQYLSIQSTAGPTQPTMSG